jgi:hypothetical protein
LEAAGVLSVRSQDGLLGKRRLQLRALKLETKQGKDTMKYALTVLFVLLAACAPVDQPIGEEAGPQAGAAAVGVNAEALLSTNSCGETLDQMRQRHRNYITSKLGGSWTWSGALSASTWYGSGSGGQTAQATVNPAGNETLTYMRRIVSRSQGGSCVAVSFCQGGNKTNTWGCP